MGERLSSCAELVRSGARLADIGTDHAKLPVWLIKSGKIPFAIASDLRKKPLEAAESTAKKYGVLDKIELRLSDGLHAYSPHEIDDITIAGMGGELILKIISEAAWLQSKLYRLILQPMSMVAELRAGLSHLGFRVIEERTSLENGKVYSAFSAGFTGEAGYDEIFLHMGKISPQDAYAKPYAEKVIKDLRNRMNAFKESDTEYIKIGGIISAINDKYIGGNHGKDK